MTPTEEARFIALWQQRLSHEAMAQRLGCPVGTVKSRSHTFQRRGLIQPRPRGQASQSLQRQEDTGEVSPDSPGVSRGVSTHTRPPSARVSRRMCQNSRHKGKVADVDRSVWGYAAARSSITWVNRSWWIARRCASETRWLRHDWGRRKVRSSSNTRQNWAAVRKVRRPPVGRYRSLIPL
jgi:hypothetical protein